MAQRGWNDPTWTQLYGRTPPAHPTPAQAQPAEPLMAGYLDQLQQAAAAGNTLNLSDLPGYQTNLAQPA